MKKLLLILSVFILTLLVLSTYTQASYAANTNIKFDETNVLDDLLSSSVNGKPFILTDYPFKESGGIEVLSFIEYCYSYKINLQSNYGLYLYIYNPSGKDISVYSVRNKIQLASAYNSDGLPVGYEKFDLRFCSASEGSYSKLFYKFKVVDKTSLSDNKTILQRVNSIERRYDISGFELLENGNPNAKEYTVGGSYVYTGYSQGYGPDPLASSTLYCTVKELETIELDVHSTFYRSEGISSLGKGHYNDLSTVYFSVPKEIINKYGNLQKIKAEWYEYRTGPIVVISDISAYNYLLNRAGNTYSLSQYNSLQYRLAYDILANGNYGTAATASFGWWWTHSIESNPNHYIPVGFFPYILSSNGLGSDTLKQYIYNYDKSFIRGYLPAKDGTLSADLFTNESDVFLNSYDNQLGRRKGYNVFEFDAGDTFNMLSYNNTHSGWETFLDFFFFPPKIDGGRMDIAPIYDIKLGDITGSDSAIASRLLINQADVSHLKQLYSAGNTGNNNAKTVFLFRFAQTDYVYSTIQYLNGSNMVYDKAYVSSETVFLDFDIITLTFSKDGVFTVIPVVSSPIDIINPPTPPVEDPSVRDYLYIVLGILLIAVGVILVLKFFSWFSESFR